jgi:hypothetical protein
MAYCHYYHLFVKYDFLVILSKCVQNCLGSLPASFGFFSRLARTPSDFTANICVPIYDFMLLSFAVKFMFRESVTVQFLLKWVNSSRLESFILS